MVICYNICNMSRLEYAIKHLKEQGDLLRECLSLIEKQQEHIELLMERLESVLTPPKDQ